MKSRLLQWLSLFQIYLHTCYSLSCFKCFYDQANPATYDCLTNPATEENCTPSGGFESCETITALSSLNLSRKIVLRQCSQNLFGFNCEQGYPMTYEFTPVDQQQQKLRFDLTQVRICFCRSDKCNSDNKTLKVWPTPENSGQQHSELEANAVCHICNCFDSNDTTAARGDPLECPAISCKKFGRNLTKCVTITGFSSKYKSKVVIRKCGIDMGHQPERGQNGQVCMPSPGQKPYFGGEGQEFLLDNAVTCSCSENQCNFPHSSTAVQNPHFESKFHLIVEMLILLPIQYFL